MPNIAVILETSKRLATSEMPEVYAVIPKALLQALEGLRNLTLEHTDTAKTKASPTDET